MPSSSPAAGFRRLLPVSSADRQRESASQRASWRFSTLGINKRKMATDSQSGSRNSNHSEHHRRLHDRIGSHDACWLVNHSAGVAGEAGSAPFAANSQPSELSPAHQLQSRQRNREQQSTDVRTVENRCTDLITCV